MGHTSQHSRGWSKKISSSRPALSMEWEPLNNTTQHSIIWRVISFSRTISWTQYTEASYYKDCVKKSQMYFWEINVLNALLQSFTSWTVGHPGTHKQLQHESHYRQPWNWEGSDNDKTRFPSLKEAAPCAPRWSTCNLECLTSSVWLRMT